MTTPAVPSPGIVAPSQAAFFEKLEAARHGRLEARGEILQQCRAYLLAVARRQLPAELRAKLGESDLVQEALTQAHEHFDRFAGATEGELLAWLTRIIEFRALTAGRAFLGNGKRDLAREAPLRSLAHSSLQPHGLVADTPGPARRAEEAEEMDRLTQALPRLSADDRRVIEMKNFELLSFVEIARRTDRTADAVRKHWGRAIERLAELLDDSSPESSPEA